MNDLDTVDYLDKIKAQQKNWIGKSEGAYVDFAIETDNSPQPPLSLRGGAERKARGRGVTRDRVTVFTTRPDTIFGATYLVLAPEHPLVARWIDEESVTNAKEAQKYQKAASKRTEQERTASFDSAPLGVTRGLRQDKKTGVVLEGVFAINPASQEKIPVWIADYVLGGYGTGAIMAVPAHDERDFAFAKKFGLPIKPVVGLAFKQDGKDKKLESLLLQMLKLGQEHNKRLIISGGWGVDILVGRRLRNHDDIDCNVPYEEVAWWKAKLEAMGFEQIPPNDAKKDSRYHVNLHRQDGDIIKVDIIGLGIDEKGVIYDMEWGSPDSWKFSAVNGIQKSVFQGLPTEVFSTEVQAWLKIYSRQKDALDKAALGVAPWIEEGVSMNSDFLDGLLTKEATAKIIDWLEKNKTGERAVMYKLRDWVFSRQRYWGEPIPIVICKKCGFVPVPDAQLPVTLPDVDAYEPTDTGESPLAKIESWVATKCPHCGGKAKRETDTMPNWAGSSWYFIRYVDPHNDHALASKENMQAWLPVDLYNGGMEHTTLHLLYSRFWYKFLFDLGIVPASCGSEPYRSRRSHGLIMAPDGEKMSKSKGNVINPDDIVKVYGADVFRVYELFMGPFDQAVPWDTNGIEGVRRFLDKAWGLLTPPLAPPQGGGGSDSPPHRGGVEASEAQLRRGGVSLETLYNQTLKKITTGIDQLQFNTCVSALMILTNAFQDAGGIPEVFRVGYLKMLAPFAPHLAEELWHQAGSGKSGSGKLKVESDKSIHTSEWPTFDPGKLQASTVELVVQINGKVREKMMVDAEITEEEAKEKVLASATVQKWLEGKTPKKVVYVKGKILSIVV
ncbi:MAG: class I tRNA ligase family protein [bacterium]|nr:class I tRNA ligase family protein [bacterium]